MNQEVGLKLDSNRLIGRTIAIANDRDRYFNDIIRKFREKYPALKIIYANDTMGAVLNPEHPQPDFLLIVKGIMTSKDPNQKPKEIILIDAPMIFTDRSIAGWTMAVEDNRADAYFDYMLDKCLRISNAKFYEFIEHMALLSLDPNDALYWKKLENTDALVSNISELYARYAKKNSTKIQDAKGY